MKKYPKNGFNTFGIYCWHAYNTNPKVIELLISTNYNSANKNNTFTSLGLFELEMRDGIQLFSIDYNVLDDENIKNKIKGIKLVIKNSFGGNKTYINQIMFYENTLQEIKSNETIESKSNNISKQENNYPEDLTNSNVSLEENININENSEVNNNTNNNIKKINNNTKNKIFGKKSKKDNNKIINGNKIKKHNIIDFISETNSKISDKKFLSKEKSKENNIDQEEEQEGGDIKIEENNIIYNGNKEQYDNININNNDENEEENKIITTSEGFQNSYMDNIDIKSSSRQNEEEYSNEKNQKIKNKNFNFNNNKKVQKLEKILKQKILKNGPNPHPHQIFNRDENFFQNYNNQNLTQDYNMNNVNNFPNFTPILKNNKNNYNMNNINNQSNMSERDSNNYYNEENNERNNPIKKYFQINANTPGRFNVNGYDYLINKKRPTTPKTNEIYLIQNQPKLRNKTLQNFAKSNLNKTEINSNKAYETLEYQLNDMEQHLQKMALNSDMLIPNFNNNNMSKSNRTQTNFQIKNKANNNTSVISNATSYMNDEGQNIINNKNYFSNYKNNNNDSQYVNNNNTFYREKERDEFNEINERIDNLEKNIFDIRNEINNISSGIKLFLDKEYFLYNFKDAIKQICYDFFSEKTENNENNEIGDQTRNENNTNEEQENSQYNSELSESKNLQNNNNAKEKGNIEEKLNKKIDEKLEYLCDNLKNQIVQKYLQPSINEIENSMKQNIEDIKKKVDTMNYSNEINTNNTNEYINGEEMILSNNNYEGSLEKKNFQRKKYEEINRLGEKLYGKLMEKEKKLNLLKQETTKLLNGKSMDNNDSN